MLSVSSADIINYSFMKRGQLITTDQFEIMKKLVIKLKLVNRG